MESFTITTCLTRKEYAKVMFVGLYKKPIYIFATILGLYYGITVIADYLHIMEYYSGIPVFEICLGIFLLLAPSLIVIIAVRQFSSNPSFQNVITYIFSDNGVAIQGRTFKSEFLWTHIIKQKELGKFLLLYHNNKFGNFIDKTKLTEDQLTFIKSKVRQK